MFTGQLGTANSKLSGVELGVGAGSSGGAQFAGDSCFARDQTSVPAAAADGCTAADRSITGLSGVASDFCTARDNCSSFVIITATAGDTATAQNTDTATPTGSSLTDNCNALDSAINARPHGTAGDKATTHDVAMSSLGNIGNGRYTR